MCHKSFLETLLGERVTHLHQQTEHTQYIFACFVSLLFWSRNKIMYTSEWTPLISDPTLPPSSVWKRPGPQTGLYCASWSRCGSELQKVPWWEKLTLLCNSEMRLSGSKKKWIMFLSHICRRSRCFSMHGSKKGKKWILHWRWGPVYFYESY